MELEELLSLLRVSARSGRKVRAELQSQRKQKQQAALAEAQSKRCGVWLAGDEHGGRGSTAAAAAAAATPVSASAAVTAAAWQRRRQLP